ncbi:MAG: hypothetical protein PVH00_06225 [Gemmatimonadota bacterium]|jgi:hypothetical protein
MGRTATLTALAFIAVLAAPLAAQDKPANMAGKWEFTYSTQRGPITMTITFAQEGEALKGTVEMPSRGGRGGGPVEISKGMIKGNDLTFSIVRTFGERSMESAYTGTVNGDTAEGTMSGMGGRGGNAEPIKWTAKRLPPG